MATSKVTPRTPGEKPPEKQLPPQKAEKPKAPEAKAPEAESQQAEFTPEQEAAIQVMVEAARAAAVKKYRRDQMAPKVADTEHPDQSKIDASKLEWAVMSKQGWVCPTPKPSDKKEA